MQHDGDMPSYERQRWAERSLRTYAQHAFNREDVDFSDPDVLCEVSSDFLTDIMHFVGEIKLGECLMRGIRNYYEERFQGGRNA